MTKQPEALFVAECIDRENYGAASTQIEFRASKELRRLHESNAELLAAITKTVEKNLHLADGDNCTLIDLVRVLEKHGVTV
jgi:hypothetical protein